MTTTPTPPEWLSEYRNPASGLSVVRQDARLLLTPVTAAGRGPTVNLSPDETRTLLRALTFLRVSSSGPSHVTRLTLNPGAQVLDLTRSGHTVALHWTPRHPDVLQPEQAAVRSAVHLSAPGLRTLLLRLADEITPTPQSKRPPALPTPGQGRPPALLPRGFPLALRTGRYPQASERPAGVNVSVPGSLNCPEKWLTPGEARGLAELLLGFRQPWAYTSGEWRLDAAPLSSRVRVTVTDLTGPHPARMTTGVPLSLGEAGTYASALDLAGRQAAALQRQRLWRLQRPQARLAAQEAPA